MKKIILFFLIVPILYIHIIGTGEKYFSEHRLQPSEFKYIGAFRLPQGEEGSVVKSWLYGGTGMTYYPHGDPADVFDLFPGSLFAVGHDWEQQVSEVSIPVPIISSQKRLEDLNTAYTLQGFHDIMNVGHLEMPRTDIAYLPAQGSQEKAKLYFCRSQHLQDDLNYLTHGWCDLDLSHPNIAGMWRLNGVLPYSTADYLFEIPTSWASVNTPGKCLATGRFRDGGWSGEGPSLYAIGPWNEGNPPAPGTLLDYTVLLQYTSTLDYTNEPHTMNDYHHSDEWSGGEWITAGTKSAVVFVGTKGTGNCWYGFANGVVWPDEPPYPPIPDPPNDMRGWWSTGFKGQFIFYDPNDFTDVVKGKKLPWEPQPYATMDVDSYLYNVKSSQQKSHLGAAAFDRVRGYFYVMEYLADEDRPLVHVWKVIGSGSGEPPFGELSTPSQGQELSGSIPITGWALDDVGVESVKIYLVDGSKRNYIGDAAFVEGVRPDVEAIFPGYPNNNRAGWGYMLMSYFLPGNGNGDYTIQADALDQEGKSTVLGTVSFSCKNNSSIYPFGTLDTPVQGGVASGKKYLVWGWVLTPKPNEIPFDGSTIDVYVDGKRLGNPVYNNYRDDIAKLFPGYANSNGAVGYYTLDTTKYKDGIHTIYWVVKDSAGNSAGIGSRYFNIDNE